MNEDRMTPEALAEIANRADLVVRNHADWSVAAAVLLAGRDVPALLDEISRTWAENAQLCETIVRDREANREICEGMAAQNARLHAELEAAKNDLDDAQPCFACSHFRRNRGKCFGAGICCTKDIIITEGDKPNTFCATIPDDGRDLFEWRGPCAENGGSHE